LFDQLVDNVEYVNSHDKSCIKNIWERGWATALSNNILRAGKHYATFEVKRSAQLFMLFGVIRPGQSNQNASGFPLEKEFFNNFSYRLGNGESNNNVHCCMYGTKNGTCYSSDWVPPVNDWDFSNETWEGSQLMSSSDELGMLLDLDEGTLSIYMNGRKLGVMKRGLAGHYCWAVSFSKETSVAIKRGTIPPSC